MPDAAPLPTPSFARPSAALGRADGPARDSPAVLVQSFTRWPAAPDPAAYRGPLGAFVKSIEAQTEADPMAVLVQLLALFGNVIGRNRRFRAGADSHFLNLFVCVVGATAVGRKGMSTGLAKLPLTPLDPIWADNRIVSGLSTGEGLIWCVRDAVWEQQAVREKGRIVGYESVMVDPGVEDKRTVVIEPEFASTLRVMARPGNKLSPTIRQAWDGGNLHILTKVQAAKATAAHVTIIGNITRTELEAELSRTDIAAGFANRFMWVCARRSRYLPDGGSISESDIERCVTALREAIRAGQQPGEVTRTSAAGDLWRAEYQRLSGAKPGLFGAIVSRAEAITMRLACLYALSEGRDQVDVEQLESALALWRFCEDSARFIFGDRLGNPMADAIIAALRGSPAGLTRTEISAVFGGNKSREAIERALAVLAEYGLAQSEQNPATGGRPTERWYAR